MTRCFNENLLDHEHSLKHIEAQKIKHFYKVGQIYILLRLITINENVTAKICKSKPHSIDCSPFRSTTKL